MNDHLGMVACVNPSPNHPWILNYIFCMSTSVDCYLTKQSLRRDLRSMASLRSLGLQRLIWTSRLLPSVCVSTHRFPDWTDVTVVSKEALLSMLWLRLQTRWYILGTQPIMKEAGTCCTLIWDLFYSVCGTGRLRTRKIKPQLI